MKPLKDMIRDETQQIVDDIEEHIRKDAKRELFEQFEKMFPEGDYCFCRFHREKLEELKKRIDQNSKGGKGDL